MDRRILKIPFTRNKTPDWVCPRCKKGVLRFVKDSFHFEERKNSKEAHTHEAWDPDWIVYIYIPAFSDAEMMRVKRAWQIPELVEWVLIMR